MILAGLGIFLMLLGSYFLIVRSKVSQLAAVKEEYKKELDAYEVDKNYLKRLKELEKRFELVEIEIIKTRKAVPDNFEIASLIVEIANIFQDSGVDIESIAPEEPVSEDKLRKQSVNVVVTHKSSMYRLLSTLRRIESSGRYIKVVGLDSSITEEDGEEILRTTVKLDVYSMPEDKDSSNSTESGEKENGT